MKKIDINFPDISHELNEKRAHQRFLSIDKSSETNRPALHLLKLIGIGFIIVLFVTVGLGILVYNSAPTWVYTCVILFMLCVLTLSFAVTYDGRIKR